MSELVSICLATYNGSKYLQEQLESICNQSYPNIEIIIQDDCSTDNTLEIIDQFQSKRSIQVYKNKKNLGYIKNFESLLKKANGTLIAISDQDDVWHKNKIQILLNNIGEHSLVYSNSQLIDAQGNTLNKTLSKKLKNHFIDSHCALNFLFDNSVSAHAMLFKKELLDDIFPFPNNIYFDAWIAATAASLNGVKYINQTLVEYRQHGTNTLSKQAKKTKSNIEALTYKLQKKIEENNSMIQKIDEFIHIKTLDKEEKLLLNSLENYYKQFSNSYFNIRMFHFLYINKNNFFAITSKNRTILSLKKSIGAKLYRMAPFL